MELYGSRQANEPPLSHNMTNSGTVPLYSQNHNYATKQTNHLNNRVNPRLSVLTSTGSQQSLPLVNDTEARTGFTNGYNADVKCYSMQRPIPEKLPIPEHRSLNKYNYQHTESNPTHVKLRSVAEFSQTPKLRVTKKTSTRSLSPTRESQPITSSDRSITPTGSLRSKNSTTRIEEPKPSRRAQHSREKEEPSDYTISTKYKGSNLSALPSGVKVGPSSKTREKVAKPTSVQRKKTNQVPNNSKKTDIPPIPFQPLAEAANRFREVDTEENLALVGRNTIPATQSQSIGSARSTTTIRHQDAPQTKGMVLLLGLMDHLNHNLLLRRARNIQPEKLEVNEFIDLMDDNPLIPIEDDENEVQFASNPYVQELKRKLQEQELTIFNLACKLETTATGNQKRNQNAFDDGADGEANDLSASENLLDGCEQERVATSDLRTVGAAAGRVRCAQEGSSRQGTDSMSGPHDDERKQCLSEEGM